MVFAVIIKLPLSQPRSFLSFTPLVLPLVLSGAELLELGLNHNSWDGATAGICAGTWNLRVRPRDQHVTPTLPIGAFSGTSLIVEFLHVSN